MTDFHIDYLELPTGDIAASRGFFEAVFGWHFTTYGPSYLGIDDAGLDTGIQADPAEATAAPLPIIRTSDLASAYDRVVAAGGLITRAPFDFPGGQRFHFREPGGTELAVWRAQAEAEQG